MTVNVGQHESSHPALGNVQPNKVVLCGEQLYQLHTARYWYLASSTMGLLRHDVTLSQGICSSVSMVSRLPELNGVVPHFGLRTMSEEKEAAWDAIRLLTDPKLPARRRAALLFDDASIAKEAATKWFAPDVKHVLEVRVVGGAKLHCADARWLECSEDEWHDNAQSYWSGEMTADPLPEVLVDGLVYFPGWSQPPFRFVRGFWAAAAE